VNVSVEAPDHAPYRVCVRLLGFVVIAAAVAVVGVGWGLDIPSVRSVIPGAVAMEVQTAIGLGAGAIVLASIPGLLGLAVLLEYILHRKLGIDEVPFVDRDARLAGMAHPGRFSPMVGVCFLILTGALLTLDRGTKWRWRPSELLAMPISIAPLMSLIGYAYSIPAFYGPASSAKLAVNTALCFLALAVALLLARPRGRVLELATTTNPAGVIVRRMVPLCVVVPLVLGWLNLRTVGWGLFNYPTSTWWMTAVAIAALISMIRWCAGTLRRTDGKRRALEARLYALANRDALTGAFSRHRFEEELDQLVARARRYGDTACLLFFDLDHMKQVNDTLGHAAGDQLLREVARVVAERLREADMLGRLGGDEFGALLLEASPSAGAEIGRDICAAIASIEIDGPDGPGSSTASMGVAPIDGSPGVSSAEILERADKAMYRAKHAGGDRVAVTDHVRAPLADVPSPSSPVASLA
jgi:diguanylate cyclase (GGDEF)-like protein